MLCEDKTYPGASKAPWTFGISATGHKKQEVAIAPPIPIVRGVCVWGGDSYLSFHADFVPVLASAKLSYRCFKCIY